MNPVYLCLIGMAVLFVALVLSISLYNITYQSSQVNLGIVEDGFGPDKLTSDERGQCLLYETTTTNTTVVDSLTPIGTYNDVPVEARCSDGFLYALEKRSRTCEANQCRGKDNQIYSRGQTELFYKKCATLGPCPNPKKILVYPFALKDGKLDLEASRCLLYDNNQQQFQFGPCQVNPDINSGQLLNIDDNGLAVRIRTVNRCLFPTDSTIVVSRDCSSEDSEGYEWKWMANNTVVSETVFGPAQMIVYESKTDYKNPEWLLTSRSLQNNGQEPVLYKSPLCNTGSKCTTQTGLISIYSWASLLGLY